MFVRHGHEAASVTGLLLVCSVVDVLLAYFSLFKVTLCTAGRQAGRVNVQGIGKTDAQDVVLLLVQRFIG